MKKTSILCYLLSLSILAIPGTLLSKDSGAKSLFIHAKGVVNRDEISGEGLNVLSLWDDRPVSPIAGDGSFTTVISNQRPQKLSLVDNKKRIRALAISLPQYSDNIVFDAKSTAVALLFSEPESFSQPLEAEDFCRKLEKEPPFQKLVSFLKKNLRLKTLEELTGDEEYTAILSKCNGEIFGEDPEAIKDSLQTAQTELQKVFQ